MQFLIKRDVLLKSLTLVQGIIEKKNTYDDKNLIYYD